jgi:NAD(P)-dependent dehydrogenase (short-subunit alcohol dehydrogenase family)
MAPDSRERRVAVVTGGAKGLGRAITERLLSDGLKVAVFARTPRGSMGALRGSLLLLKIDVTDPVQVRNGVEATLRKFGRLDVIVNNAGVSGPIGPVQEINLKEWARTLEVNLTGAFICCKYAVPHLIRSGNGGRVVIISSMAWKKATAFRTSYSASKAGLVGFTRALSRELGAHGITVNAVSPGPMEGERMEEVARGSAAAGGVKPEDFRKSLLKSSSIHRFSTPKEVAALVSFLVSKEGESITGQDFSADST